MLMVMREQAPEGMVLIQSVGLSGFVDVIVQVSVGESQTALPSPLRSVGQIVAPSATLSSTKVGAGVEARGAAEISPEALGTRAIEIASRETISPILNHFVESGTILGGIAFYNTLLSRIVVL